MVVRSKPIIPIKFPFVHVVLSHFTVMFCTICFFEDEEFVRTGKLDSPILYILLVGEILRWCISKYAFGLDISTKEFSMFGSHRSTASSKNGPSIAMKLINLCKSCALLACFFVICMFVCILLGASYQSYEGTITLSVLLTFLTILPIVMYLGYAKTIQYLFYDTFELSSAFEVWQLELLQYNAFGTLVGAWAGSVVAPLDWDRAWQTYPIPNLVGGVVGFTFANIHTFLSSIVKISDRMTDPTPTVASDKKTM